MKWIWNASAAAMVLAAGLVSAQPVRTKSTQPAESKAAEVALALEKRGKTSEAEAAWQNVIQIQPKNAFAYAHLGLLEARQEHYAEAIASYRKARVLNPGIPQLNLNLGLALFKSAGFSEAGRLFDGELAKTPGDQRLTILVAMSHYGAHQYAEAIPYLKAAAARDAKNLPLRMALAHCYLWTKQFNPTLDVYKEILLIDPDSAEADMIAGEALDEKGDNAGAVQQFQAAEKANPKEPNVHFGLAYLLWAQKRYEEAVQEFQAELANDPKNNQAMIYLGDTYLQMNQLDRAKEALERAAAFQSGVPLIHLDLGIVYQETGDKEAAIRELGKAISIDSENVNAHFRLAKLYQSMGKREEAKAEFAKASSLNKKTDEGLHQRIAEANARPEPGEKKLPEVEASPEKQ